jgi:hypothetical protein
MSDIGPFVISENASRILNQLRERPKIDWNEGPPDEIYEQDCKNYREALDGIKKCAKKDLGMK